MELDPNICVIYGLPSVLSSLFSLVSEKSDITGNKILNTCQGIPGKLSRIWSSSLKLDIGLVLLYRYLYSRYNGYT